MLKIIEIGIILKSPEGKDFRHIMVRDLVSLSETNYIVYKANQPYLWKNIEKAEKNPQEVFALPGKIDKYNEVYIVVFEGEAEKEAFEKQKWKLNENKKLTRDESRKKIKVSDGYITDLTKNDSITPGWYPLDKNAKKICFRYYHKADRNNIKKHSFFEWTAWYDIID